MPRKKPETSIPKTPTTSALVVDSNQEYEEFLKSLDLIGLGLKSCVSQLDRTAYFKISSKDEKDARSFGHKYNILRVGDRAFDAEGSFIATVNGPDKQTAALTIECTFQVHMHMKQGSAKSNVERFVKSDLQLILVPYARQFISTIAGQMAIPPVLLPMIARFSS